MKLTVLILALVALGVLLDAIWFRVMGGVIKGEISSIARITPQGTWDVLLAPAILVYLLIAVGIIFFVIAHATSLPHAVMLGALFGLVTYGIYDLTNLAVLSAWTPKLALLDIAWGVFLCGLSSGVGYALAQASFWS